MIAKYEWMCSNKNEYDWLVLNIHKTKAENDKDSGSLLHGMVAHNTTIRITVIQIFSATYSVAYRVDNSELRSKHIGWNTTDIIKLRFVINNMISFPSGPDFGFLNTILVYRREYWRMSRNILFVIIAWRFLPRNFCAMTSQLVSGKW